MRARGRWWAVPCRSLVRSARTVPDMTLSELSDPSRHHVLLTPREPLTGLEPDPLPKPLPLGGQPATLRVPRTTGLPPASPSVTHSDNRQAGVPGLKGGETAQRDNTFSLPRP